MEHSAVNLVDLAVLGTLLLSGVLAFKRGLMREAFVLGTWLGASIASVTLYPLAKPWFEAHIRNQMAADVVTGLGIFCFTLILLIPIGNHFSALIKGPTLTSIDRSLGFVFGLLRGFLVLSLLYICSMWVWPPDAEGKTNGPPWLEGAKTLPLLAYGADFIRSFVPKSELEAAEEEARKSRANAEKAVEDAQHLEDISTPMPAKSKGETSPSYNDDARNKMDQFIDRRSAP